MSFLCCHSAVAGSDGYAYHSDCLYPPYTSRSASSDILRRIYDHQHRLSYMGLTLSR